MAFEDITQLCPPLTEGITQSQATFPSAAEAVRTPLTATLNFKLGTAWNSNCRKSTEQQDSHRETLEL